MTKFKVGDVVEATEDYIPTSASYDHPWNFQRGDVGVVDHANHSVIRVRFFADPDPAPWYLNPSDIRHVTPGENQ